MAVLEGFNVFIYTGINAFVYEGFNDFVIQASNDPGWMSHDWGGVLPDYILQTGPCMACNQEVAENDWYSDSAAKFPFCKGCAKAAGLP